MMSPNRPQRRATTTSTVPMVFRDEAWAKFELGERNAIVDPRTKAPATRNIVGYAG